ncbi:MAG: DNA primase family protein [Candidatus Dormibacteria bacterium]
MNAALRVLRPLSGTDIMDLISADPRGKALLRGSVRGYSSAAEAEAVLRELAERLTDDDAAVARIVEGAYLQDRDYTAQGDAPSVDAMQPTTDIANGVRFAQRFKDSARYNAAWKRWLTWDGTRWSEQATGIEAMAKEAAIAIWDEARAANSHELAKWATRSQSATGVHGMLAMARSEPEIVVETRQLDTNIWLLNTPSGTIDLATGLQTPANRADLITKVTAAAYDPDGKCPLWDAFLAGIFVKADLSPDHDLVAYMRRLVGYSLTGSTREHMFAIFHGTGRNGKGVLSNTIRHMLGDYAGTTAADLLLSKRNEPHPTGIANLYGKRWIGCSETDSGRRLDEALVKNITGGDPLSARRMGEDFWEFQPEFKLMLATNHKPEIRGTDEGLWRRVHCVPFLRTIEPTVADADLEVKLRGEWPAIMAWAVRGCREWLAGGLCPPQSVVDATRQYRAESDAVRRFIEDRCECIEHAQVRAGKLFTAYQTWCDSEGESPLTSTAFGLDMTSRGFPGEVARIAGATARIRRHIRLQEPS